MNYYTSSSSNVLYCSAGAYWWVKNLARHRVLETQFGCLCERAEIVSSKCGLSPSFAKFIATQTFEWNAHWIAYNDIQRVNQVRWNWMAPLLCLKRASLWCFSLKKFVFIQKLRTKSGSLKLLWKLNFLQTFECIQNFLLTSSLSSGRSNCELLKWNSAKLLMSSIQ